MCFTGNVIGSAVSGYVADWDSVASDLLDKDDLEISERSGCDTICTCNVNGRGK